MIRVLIADDSAFMRKVLSDLFKSQSDFEVVGTAVNGQDAIEKVKKFQPDVLTLDVIMPVMDGLNALAVIMEQCPLPVVMVSSTTQKGTNETIRALALGAVDFVSKAGGAISKSTRLRTRFWRSVGWLPGLTREKISPPPNRSSTPHAQPLPIQRRTELKSNAGRVSSSDRSRRSLAHPRLLRPSKKLFPPQERNS